MKKIGSSVILFTVGLIVTYAILCFVIPDDGIKWIPEATVAHKIIGRIGYLAWFKSMISFIVGLFVGIIPILKKK